MKTTTIYKEEALYALTLAGFGAVFAGLMAVLRYSTLKSREIRDKKNKKHGSKNEPKLHGHTFRDLANNGLMAQALTTLGIDRAILLQRDGGALSDGSGMGRDGETQYLTEAEYMDQLTDIHINNHLSGVHRPIMYKTYNPRTGIYYRTVIWQK